MTIIHPQLRPVVAKMSFLDKILFSGVHLFDKLKIWYKVPVFIGLGYLGIRRHLHQRYNLLQVGRTLHHNYDTKKFDFRTADGSHNTPGDDLTGKQDTFFGRNMLPSTSEYGLLEPHPSVVATKLLARKSFQGNGDQFNMIAAAWIQFMIHDWVDHLEATQQKEVEITAPDEVASRCPLKSFKFFRTFQAPTGSTEIGTGHVNRRTAWWDSSVIYGNNVDGMRKVRTFEDGKVKIAGDGLLELDERGIPVTGDVRNAWAGLSLLQALFVKEHNAASDMLKKNYPEFDDGELYRHARLITSAVIAKIHTIDWTVELLKTDTLLAGMRANWYGLLGKRIKDIFGPRFGSLLSGLVGQKQPQDHDVPYSLTEEFVGVYRMHSLLPETLDLKDTSSTIDQKKTLATVEEIPMKEMIGNAGEQRLRKIGDEQMLISMGHQTSGALALWNYPTWMRDLVAQDVNGEDRPDLIDLAALEIYRDRERNVARFNEFRRNMLMIPIEKWEDLTDDQETIAALREVYGDDIEMLDLLVGLQTEKKIPKFAIGETAFFIFLLMASRRLEGDRFFTSDFNARIYTEKGFEWVNTTESLKDVIDRHFPDMTPNYMSASSAFNVWNSAPTPRNWIPLYLRPATT